MTHTAYINITKSDLSDHFNVTIDIRQGDAIHPADAGRTEILTLSKDKAVYELRAYEDLGYTLKSQAQGMLESIGLV